MNDDGVKEAVKRVAELTEIEKYKMQRPKPMEGIQETPNENSDV